MTDSLYVNVSSSAIAGIIARICTHPLDTVKARLQALYNNSTGSGTKASTASIVTYKGPLDVIQKTFRNEGIFGFYRGFPAVVIGGTPGTVLYLCSYEYAKNLLSDTLEARSGDASSNSTGSEFVVHFSSGMIAETVACVIYVPVDVVKERMQVQHKVAVSNGQETKLVYGNSYDALKSIMRNEGLSGIYKGYAATLGSFGPFSALYFVFYERMKSWARQYVSGSKEQSSRVLEQSVDLTFPWIVSCSAGAGALASWITSPLDMAKLRLQVQRGQRANNLAAGANSANPSLDFRGVYDCLSYAYNNGGVRALFRGAGARVLYFAPATTVTMTSYELCKSYFTSSIRPFN